MRPATLARDRRGSVTIVVAVSMVACMGALAFAADLGSAYLDGRRLQGTADIAALSAAANLGSPIASAEATVSANGWTGTPATVTPGVWNAAAAAPARFTAGSSGANAVRVSLATDAPLFFGQMFGRSSVRLSRTATATRINLAAFSLGSRLAAVDGGVANALASALTGTTVSLTLSDYQALATADVDILAFAKALQAQASVQALSFDDVLAATIAPPRALAALAAALDQKGATAAAAAVRKLAPSTAAMASTPLSPLIALGPIGRQDHAAAGQAIAANAWDLVHGLLELSGGARQVRLSLGGTIPGLSGVTVYLGVGDRMAASPWLTVTAAGTIIVRTAQTRLWVDATALSTGALLATYGATSIRLPVYIELGEAQAKLSALSCSAGAGSATLLVRPGIGHASIADVPSDGATFRNQAVALAESPAVIVNVGAPLVPLMVTASARTDLSGTAWQTVAFSPADVTARATKTISSSGTVGAIAASLVGKAVLTVQLGALKLPNAGVGSLVAGALTGTAPAVDALLDSLTGLLGVRLGQADVRMNGVRCGVPTLVT